MGSVARAARSGRWRIRHRAILFSLAWNGSAYECYVCGRTFRSLDALNQHLRSPAHAEKKYHCPSAWHGCGTEFKTLSGFCQHVESEQCGVWRFKGKMDRVIDGLGSGKRITCK